MTVLPAALLAFALGVAPGPLAPVAPGDVTGVQILPSEPLPANWFTEIVIVVEGTVETSDFAMEGPDRIFVDLAGATMNFAPGAFADAGRGGLTGVRADQLSSETVRFVFDLVGPLEYSVTSAEGYVQKIRLYL